jgi:hypothetical protein
MYGLAVEVERCPDGVELVTLPAIQGKSIATTRDEWTVFRYRTKRRESERFEFTDLESPIVVAFVNATDDERRQRFFSMCGLTIPDHQVDRESVLLSQRQFRHLLSRAGGADAAAAMEAVNANIAKHIAFALQPTVHLAGQSGMPRLLLRSTSLLGFMVMETAMVVAHRARLASCEKCDTVFLTGPLTSRRSHARFCSDKCRVAAMRARKAASA